MRLLILLTIALFGCKTIQCDINRDGKSFTNEDYEAFRAALGSSKGDPEYNRRADFDKNGTVTTVDYGLMLEKCDKEAK